MNSTNSTALGKEIQVSGMPLRTNPPSDLQFFLNGTSNTCPESVKSAINPPRKSPVRSIQEKRRQKILMFIGGSNLEMYEIGRITPLQNAPLRMRELVREQQTPDYLSLLEMQIQRPSAADPLLPWVNE